VNAAANASPNERPSPPNASPSSSLEVAQRLIALQQQLVDAIDRANTEMLRQQDQLTMLLLSPEPQVVETFDDDPDQPRFHLDGTPVR
jgi:hypothetical protein